MNDGTRSFFKHAYLSHEIATRLQGLVVKKVNGRPTADERAIHFERGREEGVEEGVRKECSLERDKKSIKIEPPHPTWRMRHQDRVADRDRERPRARSREGGEEEQTRPILGCILDPVTKRRQKKKHNPYVRRNQPTHVTDTRFDCISNSTSPLVQGDRGEGERRGRFVNGEGIQRIVRERLSKVEEGGRASLLSLVTNRRV